MKTSKVEKSFSRTISQLLEVSEAMFGDQKQWGFYRRVLLKRLNNLQREIIGKEEAQNEQNSHDQHQFTE